MKKLVFLVSLILLFCTACSKEKPAILFNKYPITEKTVYNYSKSFPINTRMYYVIFMPKKVETRYLYIQVIKKDNDYGQFGYKLVWTRDIRLKDEEVRYFTDYLVINEKGHYIMKVYSKDNPQKVLTAAEFYVNK